jgi:hypothetical protein
VTSAAVGGRSESEEQEGITTLQGGCKANNKKKI